MIEFAYEDEVEENTSTAVLYQYQTTRGKVAQEFETEELARNWYAKFGNREGMPERRLKRVEITIVTIPI